MMVCYHTPETKKQSEQWIEKGKTRPHQVQIQASRTKQMLLAFFDSRGLIHTDIVPMGTKINTNCIVKVLGTFLKHLKERQLEWVAQ